MKLDATGWDEVNRGLMLPPLSFEGAQVLLGEHGFSSTPETYTPEQAWLFIFKTPEVPVWIEESALKAMAACSIGQLAVGVNGINGWHQKGRSDRLMPALKLLAKKGRKIVVRFDCPGSSKSQSIHQARKLARRMEREGARNGGWWCWLPDKPGKTDDFVAALIKADAETKRELRGWLDAYVTTSATNSNYRRIKGTWTTHQTKDEFNADDLLKVAETHRVIVLKGATGTGKSKAMLAALESLEDHAQTKFTVLGAYHRSSLVHKGAHEFGVKNLSAPPKSAERAGLHEGLTMRDGLFCCGESAFKDSSEQTLWKWLRELRDNPRPTLLVLDEISQVLANWTMGGTDALRSIRSKALNALEGLLALDCIHVWAADALVGDIELNWLKSITGCDPLLIHSTFTRERDLFMGLPNSTNERTLNLRLNDVIQAQQRFWLGHGTVAGLHRCLDALPDSQPSEELRITGEKESRDDPWVPRLMANAEGEGPQYKRIGFSPAVSCGISMAATPVALTAIVQAYCWKAEDVIQALNRARNSSQRILLAPKVVPEAAGITKETTAKEASKALEERMRAGALDDYAALLADRHPATKRAVAELEARNNFECFNNSWCLHGLLQEEGYRIRDLEALERQQGEVNESPQTKQSDRRERSLEAADAFRMEALQRLALGTSDLASERREARRLIAGGSFLDLAEVDVSETWKVAQELQLDDLIKATTVFRNSPELITVWRQLQALDRSGVKRVARALGCRPDRLPGPMDFIDVRKIWPLIKVLGFQVKKTGETRANGKIWMIEPIDINSK
ncbi:DUF3854 domain-containing protein [Synechococcus sp. WH 8016]|uniref:DUF3854 domain-containing protein n=1 Tax=Synechococcus sp. WH 8016 TaxID=166318 RepID=UPI00056F04A4|nr:DUF3854 domain-containing protein [Synechococcus sp. WH 8016]